MFDHVAHRSLRDAQEGSLDLHRQFEHVALRALARLLNLVLDFISLVAHVGGRGLGYLFLERRGDLLIQAKTRRDELLVKNEN